MSHLGIQHQEGKLIGGDIAADLGPVASLTLVAVAKSQIEQGSYRPFARYGLATWQESQKYLAAAGPLVLFSPLLF